MGSLIAPLSIVLGTARRPLNDRESRRGISSLHAAIDALARDVESAPCRYTAADLDPWFDPHHEMNRVSA